MIKVISLAINFHARTLRRQIESLRASRLYLPLQRLRLIEFLASIAKYSDMVKWIILLIDAVSQIAASRLTDNVTMLCFPITQHAVITDSVKKFQ